MGRGAGPECSRYQRSWIAHTVAPAGKQVDRCRDAARHQNKGILWQPGAQRELPDEALRIEDASLAAVDLKPQLVEQRHVVDGWVIEIEVEGRRQKLVLEPCI